MAEGAGLLNQYTGNRIVGSNPTLSANLPGEVPQPSGSLPGAGASSSRHSKFRASLLSTHAPLEATPGPGGTRRTAGQVPAGAEADTESA